MQKDHAISDLKRLIEKVREVEESRFVAQLGGSGVKIRAGVGQQTAIERTGPDEESIRAFAVTFRQFTLNKDRISLQNIASIFMEFGSAGEVEDFRRARNKLNGFLDLSYPIILQDQRSGREIVEIFLYGDIIHGDREKEKLHKEWQLDPVLKSLSTNALVHLFGSSLQVIGHMRHLSECLLARISATSQI